VVSGEGAAIQGTCSRPPAHPERIPRTELRLIDYEQTSCIGPMDNNYSEIMSKIISID